MCNVNVLCGTKVKRVLVWHQGALGDLLLSLPAIRAIRRGSPAGSLHLVCRSDLRDIIAGNGLVDRVSSHEDGTFAEFFAGPTAGVRAFLEAFDAAYIFARKRDELHDTVSSCIAETMHVRTVPPQELRVHVGGYQLSQVTGSLHCGDDDQGAVLSVAGRRGTGDGRVICIHPGSGARGKCWPLDNYMELMAALHACGRSSFRILLGPAEDGALGSTVEGFMRRWGVSGEIISGRPLPEIAALLKGCALYIGNDSGISHLAGALGVSGVVIFGPTDHVRWRPWGGSLRIVHSEAGCAPCGEGYRHCAERDCLNAISAARVRAALGVLPATVTRG